MFMKLVLMISYCRQSPATCCFHFIFCDIHIHENSLKAFIFAAK